MVGSAENVSNRIDPLEAFPQELAIEILSLTDFKTLARLESVSKSYLDFVFFHQDSLWTNATLDVIPSEDSSAGETGHSRWPLGTSLSEILESKQDLTELKDDRPSYWHGITSWKQLCKKQILLRRNWASFKPELKIQQNNPMPEEPLYDTWRFRNDFSRRIVILTTCDFHQSYVMVVDMDDLQKQLWKLDSSPYTHLEYSNGHFVRDVEGNGLEIWKALDLDPDSPAQASLDKRGHFRKVNTLFHDLPTRGFHLKFPHLSVVSHRGLVWVYDISKNPIELLRKIEIPWGASGHIDQNEDVVMPSLGRKGYQLYEKLTGILIGSIDPTTFSHLNVFRVPFLGNSSPGAWPELDNFDPTLDDFHIPLRLRKEAAEYQDTQRLNSPDQWGAGMICGDYFVGISKRGRAMICSNWKGLLSGENDRAEKLKRCMAIIELGDINPNAFEAGGWLSIGFGRFVLEVNQRIYIFPLPAFDSFPSAEENQLPIHAIKVAIQPEGWRPVSFMKLYETGILYTTDQGTPYASIMF